MSRQTLRGGRRDPALVTPPSVIRLLEHPAGRGAWNMAVDETLMEAARDGRVTLRLYGWESPCLSLGRNERARGRYDLDEAARRGIDVVRRPTGGRAVYHDDELTYAVTAPAGAWGGLRESYARINRALAAGLRALGVSAETSPSASSPKSGLAAGACFAAPAPGEVTAGGRKLVGSAQWRHRGALLQHGSILLSNGQATVAALRRGSASRVRAAPAAIGLAELLGRRPGTEELVAALATGLGAEFGDPVGSGALSAAEREAAERLEARYRDDAWTWRR